MFTEQRTMGAPAGLLVLARIANMVVGLAMIPVLIHFLGGNGFAAWALLLAMSMAFSALEFGMAPTFVRHAAPLVFQGNWVRVNVVLNHAAMIPMLAFSVAAPFVIGYAAAFAERLQLPGGDWLSAGQMIVFVYAAVLLRVLLQFGSQIFNAARRFRALAAASFAQSFSANCAAALAAIGTGRVDVVLVAYWGTQLFVMVIIFVAAQTLYVKAPALSLPELRLLRSLFKHGLKIQVYDWAQIITFQFDKFLIASFLGLWAVAPYEVGNRSVQALRSIPSSGLDSFLASASIGRESGEDTWVRYRAVTRLAAIGVMVFLIAPLAIAPVFLYAWTGEMGYVARWVFFALVLGAASNVLALPAAAMAQAAGRAEIQARSAIASMLINIPLSFFLVLNWGLAGAAAGTAVAMIFGSTLLLFDVHRAFHRPFSATLKDLWQFWPLLMVCLACGVSTYLTFEYWLTSLDAGVRFSREMRLYPALVSGAAYAACLASMAAVQIHRGALSREQCAWLSRWIRFKWFVAYCKRRTPGQHESDV